MDALIRIIRVIIIIYIYILYFMIEIEYETLRNNIGIHSGFYVAARAP